MKKIIIFSMLLFSFTCFSQDKQPFQILTCSNESTFVDIRFIPKYEMIELTVTTDLLTNPREESYTKELNKDELGLVKSGSWVLDLKDSRNNQVMMSVVDHRDGYIVGSGFPELMGCRKKASIDSE